MARPHVTVSVHHIALTFGVLISPDNIDAPGGQDHDRGVLNASPVFGAGAQHHVPEAYVGLQDIITATLSGVEVGGSVSGDAVVVWVGVKTVKVRDMITPHTSHPWLILSRPLTQSKLGGGDWYMPAEAPHSPSAASPSSNTRPRTGSMQNDNRPPTAAMSEEEMALKVEMRVMTNCQVGSGTGNGSRSANGLKARGGDTCITIQLNPLEATIAPDSLAALASYFVPEFEYPFYEHLVLDALNALTEGEGQIAAKLAYLVKRAGTGARLVTTSRLFPSNSLSLPSLSLLRSHDVWHVPCAYGMCYTTCSSGVHCI